MSYTSLNGGYPATDPYRDFERREAEYAPRDSAGIPIDECGRRLFEPAPRREPEPIILGDLAAIAAAAGVATSQGDGGVEGEFSATEYYREFELPVLWDLMSVCEIARLTGWRPPAHLEIGAMNETDG